MSKRGVIRFALSILLLAYLVVALSFSAQQAAADPYRQLRIRVDQSVQGGFVAPDDIDLELGGLSKKIGRLRADQVNTQEIERRIMNLDNIESANCVVLNNRVLQLDVVPLIPVARVFDTATGTNYYINHAGKRMKASPRYRLDAPIIIGEFGDKASPTDALPVLDYINGHPEWSRLVSSVRVARNGDIMLIPMIRGHVINFGDSTDIANKFDRIKVFYHKVMPVKGWEYYDQISVKWRGQVVATRHNPKAAVIDTPADQEEYIDDPGTMGDPLAA